MLLGHWPLWAQYELAIGAIAIAVLVRVMLTPILHDRVELITVWAALAALVWMVRPGPFLVASVVGVLGALWLVGTPLSGAGKPTTVAQFALAAIVTISLLAAAHLARGATAKLALAEKALAAHGQRLEQQVDERTRELEASHRQRRSAEQLAGMGTLSAGLGHDIGNLVLPMKLRLESLRNEPLSQAARDDLDAVNASLAYLMGLASSLRLLAMDPNDPDQGDGDRATDLKTWWPNAESLLRTVIPKGATLESRIGQGGAEPMLVAMPPHRWTQIVFNLVQNAGEAIAQAGMTGTRVRVEAARDLSDSDKPRVRLQVSDTGPGMSEEVLRRCLEPFFTTKTRKLSTGMGLPLVRGLVDRAGGTIHVESAPGKGAVFTVLLPEARGQTPTSATDLPATISVSEARSAAYLRWALQAAGVTGPANLDGTQPAAGLWFVEPRLGEAAATFAQQDGCWGIVVGDPPENHDTQTPRGHAANRLVYIGPRPTPGVVRDIVQRAAENTGKQQRGAV